MAAAVQTTEKQLELPSHAGVDTDNATADSAAAGEEPVRQAWYQWFSPTDTPEERRLIVKLDLLILVFVFLAYWAKVLDQSATSAAYVSGMREDLRLFGSELNYLNAAYLVGLVVPQVPLTLLMTRARSVGWVLPAADVAWAALTLAQFRVASVGPLYALRFLVGAAGSLFFPAVQWYLGCWYTRAELGRRGALFFVASQVGGMSVGYVQAGAHATLHMRGGLEGWRWLYVICFTATLPVAALGFLCLPGLPERPRSLFLSPREAELARARMRAERRQPRRPLTRAVFKKTLTGWRFWALVGFAFFFSQADGVSANSGLPLWLKARGYSVEEINTITTVSPAVTIVSALVCGVLSDAYDAKVPLIAATALLNILASAVLAVWHVPTGLRFFAFFLAGSANGIAPVVYAWANEICAGDAEERAIVLSSMNTLGNAFGAWLPLFVWKTKDAPRYLIGYTWTIALDVGMLVMLFVLRSFWNRERAGQAEK